MITEESTMKPCPALVLVLSMAGCGEALDPQAPEDAAVSAMSRDAGALDSGRTEELALMLEGTVQRGSVIPTGPFDPADCVTWNFAFFPEVRLGDRAPFLVNFFFRREPDAWRWEAWVDGALVEGGEAGTLAQIARGTLSFDVEGRLIGSTQASRFILPDGTSVPFAAVLRFTEVDDFNSITAFEQWLGSA